MNGATLNVHGMGLVSNEPEIRQVGQRQRAKVQLAEYPENPRTASFKRDVLRVDLQLKQGDPIPKKGDVVVLDSAIYGIDLKEHDGTEQRFTNLLAFAWRLLPKGTSTNGSQSTSTSTSAPAAGAADPATSNTVPVPAEPEKVEDEGVPF
jgi:hypothetical protein